MLNIAAIFASALFAQPATRAPTGQSLSSQLPVVSLRAIGTRIAHSCRIAIPPGTVIPDPNGDGVIQVVADDVTIEFASDAILQGAAPGTPPDTMTGIAIRVDGHKGITIRGGAISGYKIGLLATSASRLTIDGVRFDNLFRQHLKSTPEAEDPSDWLWPHKNDAHEWRTNYGAAICVESSTGVTIRNTVVRRAQNGIILERVTASGIFDNDCSFLSGWGLALWRSGGNLISRNALDFCIRGYSHGVYNRGQDSAGLLMFEQCSGNAIAQNSITHGGDGLFAFAGHEAIGETPAPTPDFKYERRGCNDNIILKNDFSYAAAHGLEMTFSHGNRILSNRFAQDAICGIWGGYSHGMLIAENAFEQNGQGAYGVERGGVNIEHGSDNMIVANTFAGDKCGVHLWWAESDLLKKPGVAANEKGVRSTIVAGNTFRHEATVLHVRDLSPGHDKITGTVFARNTVEDCERPTDITSGTEIVTEGDEPIYVFPEVKLLGEHTPVSARDALGGREAIIMTEWGPWDHVSPLVRRVGRDAGGDVYSVFGAGTVDLPAASSDAIVDKLAPAAGEAARFVVHGKTPDSLTPYSFVAHIDGQPLPVSGVATAATWAVKVFPWTPAADPRTSLAAWRQCQESPDAAAQVSWDGPLSLPLGHGGPKAIPAWKTHAASLPGTDHYGLVATTHLAIPKGRWRVITQSDDGIRVTLLRPASEAASGRQTVLENWTWHGPTRDTAEFDQAESGPVGIEVEYFQIDGFAALEVAFEPVK